MLKINAQESLKKLNSEIFSLNPQTLITMFEIDMTDILFDTGYISTTDKNDSSVGVFRFHNNTKLFGTTIFWQGNEYSAAPIATEGFELTAQGTLPVPKVSLTVNSEGIPALAQLKTQINRVGGDLVGAKFTRIRTFAKYLDAKNVFAETIESHAPDPYVEFPRDIFYFERKALENKFTVQYELSSILDLEGIKLPGRLVVANKCMWTYRGEGCLYEYAGRRVTSVHGSSSTLPNEAPPVCNELDESILDIVGVTKIIDRGLWELGKTYNKGDSVYIEKSGIKYYFVAKSDNPTSAPPNSKYWAADNCSHLQNGCEKRWANKGNGYLPFGGWPSVNKFS